MSQALSEARKYEEEAESTVDGAERPGFHFSPRIGWLNDPNGFSFYNGEYHLFYQCHPYSTYWGPMHWGHAVSKDLLQWRHLPVAIAPDSDYDRAGCFSGSALTLPDGRHLLLYTGVRKEETAHGTKDIQTQCVAIGDGIDYEKYAGNPVAEEGSLPEGASRYDFRDPKIWRKADGSYCFVAGNATADGDGQVVLYRSEDAMQWELVKVLVANHMRFGMMRECPDFFVLDGKGVLLASPTEMIAGEEYHSGNGTLCLIGSYDEETDTFEEESDQAIDYGIDFYAPQTLLAPDGRRIMIGWMQNWDTCNVRQTPLPWFGQMSIPRELSIQNGRLYQRPVRELAALHGAEVKYENVVFSGEKKLDGIEGRKVDMELSLRPGSGQELYRKFVLRVAQDDVHHTDIHFMPYDSVVEVDREASGSRRAILHRRSAHVRSERGSVKLRVILDSFSVEIFVNDGEHVLSLTIYTDMSADGISFYADGLAAMDIVKHDIQM